MRTCGISYSGSELILVVLDSSGNHVQSSVKKIKLNGDSPQELRHFKNLLEAFARDESVELFMVRQPVAKGLQRSGAAAIRMDTLLRLADGTFSIETVAPQTVSAKLKKEPLARPSSVAAFQQDAYHVVKQRFSSGTE